MYLLAKLHPHLEKTEEENYVGPWLSRKAKEEIITRFYKEKKCIPLCIDHRDRDRLGYIKHENVVGRVCDLFIDKNDELIMKCEVESAPEHKGYQEIVNGMFMKREKWGVSVGLVKMSDPSTGNVVSRNLVHVALTTDPGFARHGTFITKWALSDDAINRVITRDYMNDREALNKVYAVGPLQEKLQGIVNIYFKSLIN